MQQFNNFYPEAEISSLWTPFFSIILERSVPQPAITTELRLLATASSKSTFRSTFIPSTISIIQSQVSLKYTHYTYVNKTSQFTTSPSPFISKTRVYNITHNCLKCTFMLCYCFPQIRTILHFNESPLIYLYHFYSTLSIGGLICSTQGKKKKIVSPYEETKLHNLSCDFHKVELKYRKDKLSFHTTKKKQKKNQISPDTDSPSRRYAKLTWLDHLVTEEKNM